MNPTIKALALLAAFGAPALQAQAGREAPSAQQRIARATAGLDLTADQQAKLSALADRYTFDEPGASWRLAADVEAILTDAQVQSLASKRAAHRARRAEQPERSERGARRGPRGEHGEKGGRHGAPAGRLDLTDDQREQVKEGRAAMRQEHEALRAQRQSGAITAEQYAQRSEALREKAKATFASVLTAEQRQTMQEAEARREAERAAREAVLQITPAQKAAFEAARAEAARSGERGALRGDKEELLTAEQQQIVAVHRALSMRSGRPETKGARGARPERVGKGTSSQ